MVIDRWLRENGMSEVPANIWLGTSVEDQKRADERIPWLIDIAATVRFLSCEPILDLVDLRPWLGTGPAVPGGSTYIGGDNIERYDLWGQAVDGINWVIVGAESGPKHRLFDLDWARLLRDQCAAAKVPFFYKQGSGLRPGTGPQLDGVTYHEFPKTEI